ncbi:hypothetical protein C8P64_0602 [Christiangramia gaetbulicola]|uniref:Uncharacterized protein n=1 Tax=Christiangramia gaetbulicola TaxID=703340 RepID=A0A2T6ALD5_9FLAO|nr:hypothetical protein [Christiangramia gaetbulicola]PTX44620.1 hypothetical protein C8P64_0602 [Christiangramia gaetbulicola]
MNKVRIGGLGLIITGILIGYYFNRIDIHLLSGMLIGLGIGWLITGRFIVNTGNKKTTVRSE